jgi:hypothetical protein
MRAIALMALVSMVGCAAQQQITLLPRGEAKQGTGTLDRVNNALTVYVDGRQYQGTMQMQTATSTGWSPFGRHTSSTTTNQASALLVGNEGHMRCEFGWDALMQGATGVCIDNRNATYDMVIKN